MGLCGSRVASATDDDNGVVVRSSSASMQETLHEMQIPSTKVSVTFLTGTHAIPYPGGAETCKNKEVMVGGQYTAHCTGITCFQEIGDKHFLVSDSFAPCVPIIIFGRNGTWLFHANGIGLESEIKNNATYADSDIYIICKEKHAKQKLVAEAFLERLDQFSAELVKIDTAGTIGVVVSAVSKTILVYCQE